MYPRSIVKPQVETLLVPRPTAAVVGQPMPQPITGMALLEWARGVIDAVIDPPVPNKES
jgi:transcription-repair coupling factor (superfamily II helicase)